MRKCFGRGNLQQRRRLENAGGCARRDSGDRIIPSNAGPALSHLPPSSLHFHLREPELEVIDKVLRMLHSKPH